MHRGRIAKTRRNGSAEKGGDAPGNGPVATSASEWTNRHSLALVATFGAFFGVRLCLAGTVNPAAQTMIATLGLAPLPQEGGFFREIAKREAQPAGGRAAESNIWFLLTAEGFSALHRLQAKECWRFQAGDPVEHVQLDPATGTAKMTVLGFVARPALEVTVPGGVWQGARLTAPPGPCGWALFTCTVTPAWDEKEFELGTRPALRVDFPGARAWIDALTR